MRLLNSLLKVTFKKKKKKKTLGIWGVIVNVLIMNWKKSKQGLPSHNIDMCFLLDLSNNQLSCEIPASLGALKALKMLNLYHNKVFGKVPASLGDLQI